MAPRKPINMSYIFVAAAALLLLLGAAQAEARKFAGVNPFCRTASYRRLCTKMVGGAANWHDASANAIKDTMELARRLRGLLPVIEAATAHLHPNSRKSINMSCTDNFNNVVEDLEVSLQSLDAGDVDTAKTYLSSAVAVECADALKEFGIGDEFVLSRYSDHLTQRVDNCLAVVLQT